MNEVKEFLRSDDIHYTKVPNELIRDNDISVHARMIYIDIKSYTYDGEKKSDLTAFPGVRKIAEDIGSNKDTVSRKIKDELLGRWLTVEKIKAKTGMKHIYTVLKERVSTQSRQGCLPKVDKGVYSEYTEEQQENNNQEEQQHEVCVDDVSFKVLKKIQPKVSDTKETKEAVQTLKQDFEGSEEDITAYLHYVNKLSAEKASSNVAAYFVNAIHGRWFLDSWRDANKPGEVKEKRYCPVCDTVLNGKRCRSCSYILGDDVEKHKELLHRKKVLQEDPESREAIQIRIEDAEHFLKLAQTGPFGNADKYEKQLKELYTKLNAFEKVPIF
jgi:hypothetical protein